MLFVIHDSPKTCGSHDNAAPRVLLISKRFCRIGGDGIDRIPLRSLLRYSLRPERQTDEPPFVKSEGRRTGFRTPGSCEIGYRSAPGRLSTVHTVHGGGSADALIARSTKIRLPYSSTHGYRQADATLYLSVSGRVEMKLSEKSSRNQIRE